MKKFVSYLDEKGDERNGYFEVRERRNFLEIKSEKNKIQIPYSRILKIKTKEENKK